MQRQDDDGDDKGMAIDGCRESRERNAKSCGDQGRSQKRKALAMAFVMTRL